MIIDDFKANLAFSKPFTNTEEDQEWPSKYLKMRWLGVVSRSWSGSGSLYYNLVEAPPVVVWLLKWYCQCMLTRLVTLDCLCSGIAFSNHPLLAYFCSLLLLLLPITIFRQSQHLENTLNTLTHHNVLYKGESSTFSTEVMHQMKIVSDLAFAPS